VDKSRIVLAVENIWKELQKVYEGNGVITDVELKKAKDYLRGKTALQLEDSFRLAMYHGIQLLLEGEFTPYNEVLKKIDEVGLEDVVEVANELFDSQNMSLVVVGSIPNKENEFVKIFKNKK